MRLLGNWLVNCPYLGKSLLFKFPSAIYRNPLPLQPKF